MSSIIETIRKVVAAELKKMHFTELGVVTSIFPHEDDGDNDNYECNVLLKNRDLELRKVPISTQHIGLTYTPKIDDLVLITFLNGDFNAPIITGRMYDDDARPPANKDGEIVYVAPYDVADDIRRLHVELPSGIIISVNDDLVNIEAGKTVVAINRDGDVAITSEANVNIESIGDMSLVGDNVSIESKNKFKLKAGTEAKIESTNPMELKASEVTMESQGALSVKGMDISVEGSTSMELKGLKVDVKADATMNVEAGAPLTLKGAIVNIN